MKISRYISAVVIVVSILFSGCREIELSYNEEDIPSGKDTLISIIHGSDYLFDK